MLFFRMTTFRDTWPKLEKWFTRFGTLKKVDSSQEEQELEHEVAHILETTLRKVMYGPRVRKNS